MNSTTMNNIKVEKKNILAVLKLVRRFNLKKTEQLLCEEAKVRIDELDELNDNEIPKLIASSLGGDLQSGLQNINTQAGSAAIINDPEIYSTAFENLRNFVDESLDIYKHELSTVLYPILVQIYFKLVRGNCKEAGREFVEKYGPELDHFYRKDLQHLLLLQKPEDLENNDLVTGMEVDKFVIRMSRDAHSLFKRHIQDRKQEVIAEIVAKYLQFDTYEGTARSRAQCTATAGALIGESRRQDNKVRVYYGLLKEVDFQSLLAPTPAAPEEEDDDLDTPDKPKKKKSKKDPLFSKKSKSDPNAPAVDRIPLPELRDAEKMEKLKALRESAKRVPLNKDSLPSICFYTILNAQNTVTCCEISEDSSLMAVGFQDSTIRVWSITSAKLRKLKTTEELKAIDKDAEDILTRMLDENSGETSRTFYGHSGPVFRCNFAPEKNMMLSCSEDTTIRLWSLQFWTCVVVYRGHCYPVWDVRFSPHGFYFASCSLDKTARVWCTDSHLALRVFTGHLADVDCVLFHPNSNYVATGSSDRTVRLWDVLTGQLVRLMTGHKHAILSLVFSNCGRYLASGSADHSVIIWDLANGQLVETLQRHTGTIHTLAFSRDGTILAVGGMDNFLTLWDFTKLTEDYISRGGSNATHNVEPNDCEEFLLRVFASKSSPFLTLHFTRRNLLMAAGYFKS